MADELDRFWRKLRDGSLRMWTELTTTNNQHSNPVRPSDVLEASVLGAASFPLCIGFLQNAVFRPMRLTSNKRLLGPVFGAISVAISSAVSTTVFMLYVVTSKDISERYLESYRCKLDTFIRPIQFSYSSHDIPLCALFGLAVFKVFGGRFRSVLPSSLFHPGAFARVSFPAASKLYASDSTRQKIVKIGKKYGCHSCGRRRWRSFVGDHIPPNKLIKPGKPQRFYPQCTKCSNRQGAALANNSRRLQIKMHGSTLKPYHLWLPLPGVLLAARGHFLVKDSDETTDINKSEKEQGTSLQR